MNKSNIINITRLRWLLVRILRDKKAIANCQLGLNLQRQLSKKTDPDKQKAFGLICKFQPDLNEMAFTFLSLWLFVTFSSCLFFFLESRAMRLYRPRNGRSVRPFKSCFKSIFNVLIVFPTFPRSLKSFCLVCLSISLSDFFKTRRCFFFFYARPKLQK